MEERLENVDKAGNSKHAALYLPSQLINEHKGRKVEDVFLADQPSKTTADLDVKDVAISAPFPDTHGRSESTTPDAQRELTESTTEDVRDKCLPISEELCEVATLNDQPDYLLASEVKSESKNEHIILTPENNISEACKKRRRTSKRIVKNKGEISPPPSSKPSLQAEDGGSVIAKPFTHVDQGQNFLDTPKGSEMRNANRGSSQAISMKKKSRRTSESNALIKAEWIQDQSVISVMSHLTNHTTSFASTTVCTAAAQGQISELFSANHGDTMLHDTTRPLSKTNLQRQKRTRAHDKNVTDDNDASVKFLPALLKEKNEDTSPGNNVKEKKGKMKKGRILKTNNVNPHQRSPSGVTSGNEIVDDTLLLKAPVHEAEDSQIRAGTPKHKKGVCATRGKRVKAITSTLEVPIQRPCGNIFPKKSSLCVASIPGKRGKLHSSGDLVKSDINVLNHQDDLSDGSEITLSVKQTVGNSCKNSIRVEPTVDTTKKKRSRPFQQTTMSCRQRRSKTTNELTVNQKQNLKSAITLKGERMRDLNPVSKPSSMLTRGYKRRKLEDILLKQQKDDAQEIMDVSSQISSLQSTANSSDILIKELVTSQTKNIFVTPIKATVTKPPHNVPGKKKRRRPNKTGWATKVKSKRRLSNVNCRDALEALVQSSIVNPGLPFKSSLCQSLTENATLESVENEKEHKAVTNNDLVHMKSNPRDQPLSVSAKCRTSSVLRQNRKTKKPMSCLYCGRTFRHISAYTIHKRIHTGEKPYRCQKCGKSFAQISQLNSHSNIHEQHGPLQCPYCFTQSPNIEDLIDHFKIHIKGTKRFHWINPRVNPRSAVKIQPYADYTDSPVSANGLKSLRCSTCFKDFFHKATLQKHLELHRGQRRFTCNICNERFSKSSSFNPHKRKHWPVKPYACSVCGKAFDLLRELKAHTNMHLGESPFFCNLCGQSFSNFSSLRSHQAANVCFGLRDENDSEDYIEGFLVEKRSDKQINTPVYFKCQICKQLYRHWCQYILHLQTHTYSEPDLCEICGQQYDQELVDKFVHCQVCCKSSGEQKACNSALSDVWQKPQSVPSKESEIDLDSHHEDHQETSTDDQRPQREEAELRPSLQPLEVYSSDVQQNPNSARQTPGNVFAITPSSPPNSRRPNPVRSSLTAMSCSSLCVAEKTSGFRTRLRTHAPCDRYSCRQCGKSFTHWNKLWLHQGLHREKRFMFSCTQCNCKFRFFGSYREHMNEHAAQRPYACPLCPNAYVVEEDLNAHLCKNHQPSRSPACDTCGKWFSSLRNLERHRLLHTGAISHYCLPCRLPFPSNQALRDHLQSHEGRPVIPLPHGSLEPLRFPHRCRKCNGRFTTTEFLRSHQVCHSRHDGNTFSSLANIVSSSLTYKLSNEHAERVVFSPQKRPCLSTSTKKHLYRYRNPDRLYVVPKIVSQPPVTISDTEEDSPSISNSSSPSVLSRNTVLLEYEEQTGPRNDRCEASPCRPSQPSPPSSCILIHVPTPTVPDGTPIQTHTSRSSCQTMNVQTPRGAKFAGDDDAFFRASKQIVMQGGKDPQFGGYECADCSVTFGDISELHEHYLHHARGVK